MEAWMAFRQGVRLTKTFHKLEVQLRIKKAVAMKVNPIAMKGALFSQGLIDEPEEMDLG